MKCHSACLLPTIMAGLLLFAAGCGRSSTAEAAKSTGTPTVERVTAGHPQRKDLTLTTTQPAGVKSYDATPLSPRVAGNVGEVLVNIGDRVKGGQVLLKIDAPEMLDERRQKQAQRNQAEAEVGQAQAGIVSAEAEVTAAKARTAQAEAALLRAAAAREQYQAEFTRISELAKARSVTEQLVDETRAKLRAAEAGEREAQSGIEVARSEVLESEAKLTQAQANLTAATARQEVAAANLAYVETMLGYLEVKAPYDSVVTLRNVDPGHYVRSSAENAAAVLAVARMDKLRVYLDVPEAEAGFVSDGDPAFVRVQALSGREYTAKVSRTSWALANENRSLRVEIDIENQDDLLRPGMYATVKITLDQRPNVLTLPATAVVRDGTQTQVCVVRDGKIARTPVHLGLRAGDDVEIVSGVTEADEVVLIRSDGLADGQAVEINPPPK
ncbi:MAG: efflux RND transporter periplasmic adaptor subunit [Planctomycetaceae bacterium]